MELQFYNGFTPTVGDSFTLLTADSVSGSFSAVNAPEGTQWSTQITGTSFSVTAIPEPEVLAYLLFAALICIRFFRK